MSGHRIPTKIRKDIPPAVKSNPSLKTSELSCGQGLGYCPASADLSAVHKGRINSIRKQVLRKTDGPHQGYLSLLQMEKIADNIDEKDKENEGSKVYLWNINNYAGHTCGNMASRQILFIN